MQLRKKEPSPTTFTSISTTSTSTPRRTFYTEGPPDPKRHYMVPVNDSKMEEILTFFASNDPQRGAAFKFCAVYSHRQGGKSTRLAEIKRRLQEKNLLVVEVDARELSQQPEDFYSSLAFEISSALYIPEPKVPCPKDCTTFNRLFKGEGFFVRTMREQKKEGLILLFEEMDGLQCKEEFWSALSPLLETNQKVLEEAQWTSPNFPNILRGVIGVGVHRIVRDSNPGSTSSPPNKKRDIALPHFTKEQVDEHLWQPAEHNYNFKLTEDAKELLYEFIQGHPGLTCRAGTKILALITSKQTSSTPFSFTQSCAVSILHRMILNSRHESPLDNMVTALENQFQSGKTLKQVLRSILFNNERPEISSDEDEFYYAIDKGLLRLEVSENQQRVDEPTGYLEFECPIILHALLPRIFPEAKQSFQKRNDAINSVKNLPREFPTLLKGFIHQINIDTLQGSSQKTQRRLADQMSCSEKIPAEAAYHFQFYFFLERALREGGFSVLAELHPWKVKGQERRRIDLYVDGNAYHFGIELAAGIENSKYKTYLERTEAYRVGFNDKHAFFVLFTTIPRDLWSDLWKTVENQAHNEAGTGVFCFIVSHDPQFVDWAIHGYNIPKPIVIQRQSDETEALTAGLVDLLSYVPFLYALSTNFDTKGLESCMWPKSSWVKTALVRQL
jgi:hypothetical protein